MSMKNQNPFQPFSSFVFRSPFFPLTLFTEWLNELDKSSEFLKKIVSRFDIQESVFLATPVLYSETYKYLEDSLKPKDKEKFFFSFLKYLSRMASRCTPFGLFAGCSVGEMAEKTNIAMPDSNLYSRHTRLDMNYLCSLIQDISKKSELRQRLRYYPNNSIYLVGDKLRYIEFRYNDGIRRHNIIAIENSEYLQCLLACAKDGATLDQMAKLLVDEEITMEEAWAFLDELIDNQVLTSELEPSITGLELLDQLIFVLKKIEDQQELGNSLQSLSCLLLDIDTQPIGTTLLLYDKIKEQIKALGTTFNEKYLFQSDMIKHCEKAEVSKKITNEILHTMTFLNKLSPPNRQETFLDKFASSFYDRYEDREIPLAQLLDSEMGLDMRQSGTNGDISPLLEGISFGRMQYENTPITWSGVQSLLYRKIMEALLTKQQEVFLTDEDVKNVQAKWDDLPHTITAICEIFSYDPNGQSKIYLHPMGGSSAANLLGRFCHVDEQIHNAVKNIIREEELALPPDKLYAEIVHISESRTGNILARPVLHQYEIPYLAKSAVDKEFQLEISDLMVSVRQRKFVLRSKRLNKEIIPRLTTSHNFFYSGTTPIYQFLCNLQQQQQRGLGIVLSPLFNEYPYLPRISYKNVILVLARWHVKLDEIKPIVENKDLQLLEQWRTKTGIPRFVVLPDGDNELFVDTQSLTSVSMLYSVVKKRQQFTLQEFLFDTENAILKTEAGAFTNEFIFTFHKTESV